MGLASQAETAAMAVRISLEDRLSPGIAKINRNLSGFEKGMGRTGKGVGQLAGGLAKVGVVAAGAAATGIAAAVHWAGDFEAQLNTINTIAQTTPEALKGIGDGIRKIARDTGITTDELTASYYDLLSAGIKTADAQAVLNDAVTLGIGGLATTTETVDLLTTAYNAYGLDAKGAAIATDQFAQAINDGKVKASEIAATFANVASVAKTAGIGIDQIAASYGFLTAQGIPAAEVTTEMNRAIIELIKPNAKLAGLQKKLGTNYEELARKKGLVPALEQLREDAKKAGIPLAKLFGRLEGYKYVLQTTGPKFKEFMAEQAKILNSSGEAAKQAAERQQGFNYSMSVLTANVKDAGITIGSYLLPPLADLAQKAAAFLRRDDIQAKLKDLGAGLASAIKGIDFDKLVTAASGFAKALDPALQTLLTIGKLIASLPPEVLGAGAGVIVANKISGGAIGSGVGNIVGGVGESLTKGLLAKIPFLGGAFVQPVRVVNLPPGGLGGGGVPGEGGPGKIAKGLAAVSVITDIAAVVATQQEVSAQNSQLAADINANLQAGINVKTPAELQTALAGVNQGIKDIQSNPLNVLVQGDALTTLQSMANDLKAKLANGQVASEFASHGNKWRADSASDTSPRDLVRTLRSKLQQLIDTGKGTSARADRIRAKIIEAGHAQTAAENLINKTGQSGNTLSRSGNAKLATIAHKKTSFRVGVTNNIGVSTRVSVSAFQQAQEYYSRVTRNTSVSSGDFGRGK